jgi:CTP:molybdopterin cytidylyltransferase MocA
MTTYPGLHAVVLAAGASRRFGAAKQLLPVAGAPLLIHVARRAAVLTGDALVVVLGARAAEIEAQLPTCPGRRLLNPAWEEGIGSSVRMGVGALPGDCTAVLVMLADQAAVSVADLTRLAEAWRASPERIAAAAYGETPAGAAHTGVPAIFPRAWFAELLALTGDTGARALLARHGQTVQAVPMASAAFDIDTPEDAARYLAGEASPAHARTR